jgi:hypothetical protein
VRKSALVGQSRSQPARLLLAHFEVVAVEKEVLLIEVVLMCRRITESARAGLLVAVVKEELQGSKGLQQWPKGCRKGQGVAARVQAVQGVKWSRKGQGGVARVKVVQWSRWCCSSFVKTRRRTVLLVTSLNWSQLSPVPSVGLASSWTSSQCKLPLLRIYHLDNDLCKFVEREKV